MKGIGGFYRRKNPNVQITRLKREWVADAIVVYIGCSGNLNNRIKLLMQFGEGQAVRHWGGRLIWQLEQADQLQVCCKVDALARRNQGEFDSFISIEVWQETFRESKVNLNCSSKSYFGFNIFQTSVRLSKERRSKFCVDSD